MFRGTVPTGQVDFVPQAPEGSGSASPISLSSSLSHPSLTEPGRYAAGLLSLEVHELRDLVERNERERAKLLRQVGLLRIDELRERLALAEKALAAVLAAFYLQGDDDGTQGTAGQAS